MDPEIPLTILHHDECLVFPGYNVMVGKSCGGQYEEHKRTSGLARKIGALVPAAGHGRDRSPSRASDRNERVLVIVVIVWCVAYSLHSLLKHCKNPISQRL